MKQYIYSAEFHDDSELEGDGYGCISVSRNLARSYQVP